MIRSCISSSIILLILYLIDANRERRPVIIVSIDGFRYDFLRRSKALQALKSESVFGPMIAQFPTYTFVNHYSIMTGLYPIHHGIVSNHFYDTNLNKTFNGSDNQCLYDKDWWLAEPLWITASLQGLKTFNVFWPGDQGFSTLNHNTVPYNGSVNNDDRISMAMKFIDENSDFSLLSLYFSIVDDAGHRGGPDSQEMTLALAEVDRFIKILLEELAHRNLLGRADLIFVSDHGVSPAQKNNTWIMIDELIPELHDMILYMDYRPVTFLYTKPGKTDKAFNLINSTIQDHNLPMKVFYSDDLKENYHICTGDRIGQLTIIADEGYSISNRARRNGGFHGYAPELNNSLAFFMGFGPSFRKVGELDRPANNLDIYNLVSYLLNITPNPNNGTNALINEIIR